MEVQVLVKVLVWIYYQYIFKVVITLTSISAGGLGLRVLKRVIFLISDSLCSEKMFRLLCTDNACCHLFTTFKSGNMRQQA